MCELEPIEHLNYATTKDGTVSDGLASSDTTSDGLASSDTTSDGTTDVAVKGQLNTKRRTARQTRPRQTAALVAHTANSTTHDDDPVKRQQRTANGNGWGNGKGPTMLFAQPETSTATDDQVAEILKLLTPKNGAVRLVPAEHYKQAVRLIARYGGFENCKQKIVEVRNAGNTEERA